VSHNSFDRRELTEELLPDRHRPPTL
jgi:hypothetical protein